MRKAGLLLAIAGTLASSLLAQSTGQPSNGAAEATALINQLMNRHVQFLKGVPLGWSIQVKESGRTHDPKDGLVVAFRVYIQGAPKGLIFDEISWPVSRDTPVKDMEGISIGKDGILMCGGRDEIECRSPQGLDDPIDFTMVGPLPGEPFRMAFSNPAGTIGAVVVPIPIESRSKGCSLSGVRLTPGFELGFVSGEGYAPNTDIHVHLSTGVEVDTVVHSDERGGIKLSVLAKPKSPDQKSGVLKVKVMEAQCSPEISYKWGNPKSS